MFIRTSPTNGERSSTTSSDVQLTCLERGGDREAVVRFHCLRVSFVAISKQADRWLRTRQEVRARGIVSRPPFVVILVLIRVVPFAEGSELASLSEIRHQMTYYSNALCDLGRSSQLARRFFTPLYFSPHVVSLTSQLPASMSREAGRSVVARLMPSNSGSKRPRRKISALRATVPRLGP